MWGVGSVSRKGGACAKRQRTSRRLAALCKEFRANGGDFSTLPDSADLQHRCSQDGLLGSLILESIISPVFAAVANDLSATPIEDFIANDFPFENIAEEISDYYHSKQRFKKGAGKGTSALLHGSTGEALSQAFEANGRRRSHDDLEEEIGACIYELDHLNAEPSYPAPYAA